MSTPLSPSDPDAGRAAATPAPAASSQPGSQSPASASPSGAGTGADAGAEPPAAPAPPPPAPQPAAPDAVVTCPCDCSDAVVTSEMVMEEPPDRARLRMAVAERVRVIYSKGAAEWTIAGDGELSSTSGATVTFTAPNAAGSVTLTATGSGCSATITFTIVEPNAVHMIKKFNSPTRVEHTLNMPDVGMFTNIFFGPTDVNFHRVRWIELEIGCTATGLHLCHNGSGHGPNANALGMTTHVQAGMGTAANAFDHVYSGHCGIPWSAPLTGGMVFHIPWRWRIGNTGAFKAIQTVTQRIVVDAAGLCTATKAGARATVLATAPTTTP